MTKSTKVTVTNAEAEPDDMPAVLKNKPRKLVVIHYISDVFTRD